MAQWIVDSSFHTKFYFQSRQIYTILISKTGSMNFVFSSSTMECTHGNLRFFHFFCVDFVVRKIVKKTPPLKMYIMCTCRLHTYGNIYEKFLCV